MHSTQTHDHITIFESFSTRVADLDLFVTTQRKFEALGGNFETFVRFADM